MNPLSAKKICSAFTAVGCSLLAGCLLSGCALKAPGTNPSGAGASVLTGTEITPSDQEQNPMNQSAYSSSTEENSAAGSGEASQEVSGEVLTLPSPGLHTLENFLVTALEPVGNTMYVWGGGWNEEDTGAGVEACSIGLSDQWKAFSEKQTKDYNHKNTRYQIHDGLDCSGFLGWAIYNTMESENGRDGYVMKSTDLAPTLASYGWGDYLPVGGVTDWLAGDVASMKGHVWICLGTCQDGSVLLLHSSPPGVRVCGTMLTNGTSMAVSLAETFMSKYYPKWYSRFPECAVDADYLEKSGVLRWNTVTFPDADEIRALTPEELLDQLNMKGNKKNE